MADPLLNLVMPPVGATPPWGIVERVETGAVYFRLVGTLPGEPAAVARRKFASTGTISAGDKILVTQIGQSGWIIMDCVVSV